MTLRPALVTQRLEFPGALGHPLAARLDSPAVTPRAYALLAHCFTCTKDLKSAVWIARTLVHHSIAVLRFDFTGIGESGGAFEETNFSSNVGDLTAAADFLRRRFRAPALLVGHSLGGTASLVAAEEIPECRAVVTLASPSDTEHFRQTVLTQAPDLAHRGKGVMDVGGVAYPVRRQLLEDLEHQHVQEHIRTLGRALLVIHSQGDETIPIEHAERIFAAARHPKAFVSLGAADHLLLQDREDAPRVGELIASWAALHLDAPPVTPSPPSPPSPASPPSPPYRPLERRPMRAPSHTPGRWGSARPSRSRGFIAPGGPNL